MSGARLGCPLLTARLPCGTGEIRYRCFLPDLTEFAAPSCTGPNYQQSASHLKNSIRLETLPFTDTVWFGSLALYALAERGGFEPPVLFWSTHDFQSCTFNRSVTSPRNIRIAETKTAPQARSKKLPQCIFVFHKRIVAASTDISWQVASIDHLAKSINAAFSICEGRGNIPLLNCSLKSLPIKSICASQNGYPREMY